MGKECARVLGREGSTDDEQLLVASQDGRILVTHSEQDFILLHYTWQRWAAAWGVTAQHAGILIVPQGRRHGIKWAADAISQAVTMTFEECEPVASISQQSSERPTRSWRKKFPRGRA